MSYAPIRRVSGDSAEKQQPSSQAVHPFYTLCPFFQALDSGDDRCIEMSLDIFYPLLIGTTGYNPSPLAFNSAADPYWMDDHSPGCVVLSSFASLFKLIGSLYSLLDPQLRYLPFYSCHHHSLHICSVAYR